MSDPTFTGVVGGGRTVFVLDSKNLEGGRPNTDYGYQNNIVLRDVEGTEVHIILSDANPQGDSEYNSAPVGSICIDYANGALYVKDAAGDNWAAVDVTT